MGARYYDPLAGRFLSRDAHLIGAAPGVTFTRISLDSQQFNSYVYARNNPIILVDRGGNYAESPADAILLSVSIAEFGTDPGILNGIAVAVDVVGLALPIPAVGGLAIREGPCASQPPHWICD